jgi:hypothetical protein
LKLRSSLHHRAFKLHQVTWGRNTPPSFQTLEFLASSSPNPSTFTTNPNTNASTITHFRQMVRRRRPPRPGALTELPPLKILTQIVLLQTIWYGVATALILFTALVAGKHFSIDLVLSWRSLRGDTTVGWMLGLVWLLNSLIGYVSFSRPSPSPLQIQIEGIQS